MVFRSFPSYADCGRLRFYLTIIDHRNNASPVSIARDKLTWSWTTTNGSLRRLLLDGITGDVVFVALETCVFFLSAGDVERSG